MLVVSYPRHEAKHRSFASLLSVLEHRLSFVVLACVIGSGTAAVIGLIYLINDEDEQEQLDVLGLLLAAMGLVSLAAALLLPLALFFAVAGFAGAATIFAGRLLIPLLPVAYVALLGVAGLVFVGLTAQALISLDLAAPRNDLRTSQLAATSGVVLDDGKTLVRGTVTDRSNQPLANANVTLKGPLIFANPALAEAVTDENGSYRLDVGARGTYELKVIADGYEAATQRLRVEASDFDAGSLVMRQKITYEPVQDVLGIQVEQPFPTPPPPAPTPVPNQRIANTAPVATATLPIFTPRPTLVLRTATPYRTLTPTMTFTPRPSATPRLNLPSQGGVIGSGGPAPAAPTATRTPTQVPSATAAASASPSASVVPSASATP
jgi:hypothetical protein